MNEFGTLLVVIAVLTLSLRVGHPSSHAPSLNPAASVQQTRPATILLRYENGELWIDASSAPLCDILRAVRDRTGALIDIPSGADEHVSVQIGPGTVIEVLGSLLNQSDFNYLIEELKPEQGAPVRVVLSPKGQMRRPAQAAASVASSAAPEADAEQSTEVDARQQGFADRSALLRQIKEGHLRQVDQVQREIEQQVLDDIWKRR